MVKRCCEPGSYECNMSMLMDVDGQHRNTRLCFVDRCLGPELVSLWNNGIETIESCCGHGYNEGYIAVAEDCDEKMLALGYQHQELDPQFYQHCYTPKINVPKRD